MTIKAERLGLTETEALKAIATAVGEVAVGISSVALTETLHGIYRAKIPAARQRRELFIRELLQDVRVFPTHRT